jgi:hypothetical protein
MGSSFARLSRAVVCVGASLTAVTAALAQVPSNYGAYYSQNINPGSGLAATSPNRYLYDKYFYHRPSVSPYANLNRPGTDLTTAYQAYVRPELERREAMETASRAYIQQRKLEGKVGETRYPGAFTGNVIMKPVPNVKATPPAYYNHWYGGWKNK